MSRKYDVSSGSAAIWESIRYMDHEGMDILRYPAEKGALEKWEAYLARTKVSRVFFLNGATPTLYSFRQKSMGR